MTFAALLMEKYWRSSSSIRFSGKYINTFKNSYLIINFCANWLKPACATLFNILIFIVICNTFLFLQQKALPALSRQYATDPINCSRMQNPRHMAAYSKKISVDFETRESAQRSYGKHSPPPPRIIKAIGDPTTAAIFHLYDKCRMRAETNGQHSDRSACDEAIAEPLLTIFVTDLRPLRSWGELCQLIRLYFSSVYRIVIFFGVPPRINRGWAILLSDFLRFYRPNSNEFATMYRDIGLMNDTIFRAQAMPCLTLRRWNLMATLGTGLGKAGRTVIRKLCAKTVSLSAYSLIQLQKALFCFGH